MEASTASPARGSRGDRGGAGPGGYPADVRRAGGRSQPGRGRGGGGGGAALRPGARRDGGDDHGRYQRGPHRSARGGGGHPGTWAGQRGQRDRARGARPAARGGDRGHGRGRRRGRISHQRIDQAALGRSVAKAAVTVGGPPAAAAAVAAGAVATALGGAAGTGHREHGRQRGEQDGPPRVENGVESQTRRAAEDGGRAGRAILAEAVRGRGPSARRCRHRRARAAGPAAGRRDRAGLRAAGDHRHRGRGRAHAGGHAAVGGARAAPAADLQRPGHDGLRAARRDRRRALPATNTGPATPGLPQHRACHKHRARRGCRCSRSPATAGWA